MHVLTSHENFALAIYNLQTFETSTSVSYTYFYCTVKHTSIHNDVWLTDAARNHIAVVFMLVCFT